ncbi:hypothetical protein CEXT_211 [Caerostris extrusa]|uniref:Uncharacterized protein n=1 Tax=Caerostris extrusa TaxID=172846 RepID=A0AAV4WUQ0_CAEEX|nr:hypothetical protein CEXT_211 [Caerostris extrusa]
MDFWPLEGHKSTAVSSAEAINPRQNTPVSNFATVNNWAINLSSISVEAVIHFVSHNVTRSYSDAISDSRSASGIILGLQKWLMDTRIHGRFHFKTSFSHLPLRCLQSVDRSTLCGLRQCSCYRKLYSLQVGGGIDHNEPINHLH